MKPVVVGGFSVGVEVAHEDDEPELENLRGCYLVNEGRICISEELSQEQRQRVFMHELCHANNAHLSVEQTLKRIGLSDDAAVKVEEYIAELFEAHTDTLVRNGWLKLPLIR